MIRVYFLRVTRDNDTEHLPEADIIHDALLLGTDGPDLRQLIMDTNQTEHTLLAAAAVEYRDASAEEAAYYNQFATPAPYDPDYDRVVELLATSPDVITAPEQWELLRIFGRKLGYPIE